GRRPGNPGEGPRSDDDRKPPDRERKAGRGEGGPLGALLRIRAQLRLVQPELHAARRRRDRQAEGRARARRPHRHGAQEGGSAAEEDRGEGRRTGSEVLTKGAAATAGMRSSERPVTTASS